MSAPPVDSIECERLDQPTEPRALYRPKTQSSIELLVGSPHFELSPRSGNSSGVEAVHMASRRRVPPRPNRRAAGIPGPIETAADKSTCPGEAPVARSTGPTVAYGNRVHAIGSRHPDWGRPPTVDGSGSFEGGSARTSRSWPSDSPLGVGFGGPSTAGANTCGPVLGGLSGVDCAVRSASPRFPVSPTETAGAFSSERLVDAPTRAALPPARDHGVREVLPADGCLASDPAVGRPAPPWVDPAPAVGRAAPPCALFVAASAERCCPAGVAEVCDCADADADGVDCAATVGVIPPVSPTPRWATSDSARSALWPTSSVALDPLPPPCPTESMPAEGMLIEETEDPGAPA